jgi:hypothetical protein
MVLRNGIPSTFNSGALLDAIWQRAPKSEHFCQFLVVTHMAGAISH